MARKFTVERNKEPLYWAIGLLILSIWCFRDGWYPTASKLEKYPEVPSQFWSLALDYEYYRFNRVTSLLTGIASGVMFVIHFVVNREVAQ